MERSAMQKLLEWKNEKHRKPMIIRGARQVGKTWLMKEFGRTQFEQTAYINFDENIRIREIFEGSLDKERLLLAISAETGLSITPQNTLIIFDEVQEAPRALASLKYFCENAPEYPVIAAGSLLGVALHKGTSFPVGKVDFLDLYPLNYREFLRAAGEEALCAFLEKAETSKDISMITAMKEKYIDHLRQYYYIGGMPEVVADFMENKDYNRARKIQTMLLDYYQQDFSKHADAMLVTRLNQVWNSIPSQLAKENKKFIYGQIREGARARDFELAIQWLEDCGLVHKVHRVSKPGIPLNAYAEFSSFKMYMNDVGLLAAKSGLPLQSIVSKSSLFAEFKGALTEQYILQQLISDAGIRAYYYATEHSRGEIDFIVQAENECVPIEVKAEENLRAKSLRAFYDKYEPRVSIRTSMSDYRREEWLVNVPLYAFNSHFLQKCVLS
ncbi:MAG: ATP-binding protein [Ruminococcus sp.]|nr:ATP-binding protein [Ruminococcus sp.]